MNNVGLSLPEVAKLLRNSSNVLIFAHIKPDGDAIGSALGLGLYLRHNNINNTVVLPGPIPAKYLSLSSGLFQESISTQDASKADLVVLLDCARSDRAATGGLDLHNLSCPLLCIDHHVDSDVKCDYQHIGKAAATAALIGELSKTQEDWIMPPEAATLLYLGLLTDTGGFRFSNTDAAALEIGSYLLSCGANATQVVNDAFFSKSANQQLFESDLILNNVFTAHSGRLRYGIVTNELLEKYNFNMKDGESVIELLREIDQTVVAALAYPNVDGWRLSLRSKDPRYPVGPLARLFGGGGHEMAAGATLPAMSQDDLSHFLTLKIGELLNK